METKNEQLNYVPMYKSYIDAVARLSPEDRLAIYEAIFEYGFTGIEPTFDNPYLEMGWNLVKPNLLNNIARVKSNQENGKKGGRPKKETLSTKVEAPKEAPKQVLIENDTVVSQELNEVIKTRIIEDDIDTTLQLNNGVIVSIKKEYEEVYNSLINDKPKTFKELKNSTGQGDFEYTLKRSYESYMQLKELENL